MTQDPFEDTDVNGHDPNTKVVTGATVEGVSPCPLALWLHHFL